MNYTCPLCNSCHNFNPPDPINPYGDIWRCIGNFHNAIIYQDKFWRLENFNTGILIFYSPRIHEVTIRLHGNDINTIDGDFELKDAIIILNKCQQLKAFL